MATSVDLWLSVTCGSETDLELAKSVSRGCHKQSVVITRGVGPTSAEGVWNLEQEVVHHLEVLLRG